MRWLENTEVRFGDWQAAVSQLLEQSTNDPEFKGLIPVQWLGPNVLKLFTSVMYK
jgi:hypothetical protein